MTSVLIKRECEEASLNEVFILELGVALAFHIHTLAHTSQMTPLILQFTGVVPIFDPLPNYYPSR